jgi:asparagine synthase (glutamine-hydrolysing)
MCGIAGVVSKTNNTDIKSAIWSMSKSIKHRGPDGEGFVFISDDKEMPVYSDETPLAVINNNSQIFYPKLSYQDLTSDYLIAFAHRRLSIIDLSETGHQPMSNDSGNWISFNGEIYNYIELKEELKQKGYSFFSNTDTEVVLNSYQEWGEKCLDRFNGMFSFVIYDKRKNHLFCARDRVGVKPFYFINTAEYFAFSSEVKTFIKSGLCSFEINEKQQFDFIINSNLETEQQGLVKNIQELKPAHYIHYNLQTHSLDIRQYYQLPDEDPVLLNEVQVIERIEEAIINSVKLRLRSDVEVGSCLSGGLDSTVIAGLMRHLNKDTEIKLFSAVFPGEKFDETIYAQLASKHVNGNWKTVSPSAGEFYNDVRELNYFQDMPVWSTSTYAQHRVMKLASENGIKVVLDGQGADELFAGYAHHYMALWKEQFSFLKVRKTISDINDSKQTVFSPYKQFAKQLIKDTINLGIDYGDYFNLTDKTITKANPDSVYNHLNTQLKFDYQNRLKSYLKCEDRCSMAFGIESRVPFADDIHLVNLLFSIPGKQKIIQGISKFLLREAASAYIPKEIKNRKDKVGFESPLGEWLRFNKKEVLDTIFKECLFVNKEVIFRKFDYLCTQKATFLFRLYSFAVWKEVFRNLSN